MRASARLTASVVTIALTAAACRGSDSNGADDQLGIGGTGTTGGSSASPGKGGTETTGGSSASLGNGGTGATSVAGIAGEVGGDRSTGGGLTRGGAATSGGSPATGGATPSTGGTKATGGSTSTGGAPAAGGVTTTGGTSATGGAISSVCGSGTPNSNDVVVDLNNAQQKISGFGASTAWSSSMSVADADLLWSTTSGAGLSLHRIRIDTTGTGTSETNIAKLAVARGVTVWATPWTPPAADKDNNNIVMGHLSNGKDFASKLATFVKNMKDAGVPIYAVSAQNEPDAKVDYESCVYDGTSIASFIGTYMGPALADSGVKIMAPETQNWCGFEKFWPAMSADAKAMSYISIVATHEYGCNVKAYPEIAKGGREFWETEMFDDKVANQGIESGLVVAKLIHDALTIANMNAWHYWWVYTTGGANGLWDKAANKPSKRLWVMGNYSRFARPGYQRVSTNGSVPSNVLLTAFKSPVDGTVVVVAANTGNSPASVSVFVSGAAPCTVTPYVTSSNDNLASKAVVSVSGGRFTYSLPAQTVTTFIGKP